MSLTIPDFSSVKALVVGDVMLDEYWFGSPSRISPEAPVPVVRMSQPQARAGLEALKILARAIELGFLPPAPAERACNWFDFRPVCGPDEPLHLRRKPADSISDLTALRGMP